MLRLLGAMFVIVAAYLIGIYISSRYIYRNEELVQIRQLMLDIRNGITYKGEDIYAILSEGRNGYDETFKKLLYDILDSLKGDNTKTFDLIWSDSIANNKNSLYLTKGDIDTFISIGKHIGDTGAIDYYIKELDEVIHDNRVLIKQRCKTIRALSIFAGMIIVIVLI